ncbi:CwfJ C-terminus 2-domain-containing protein-like protein [Pavlovales sp. CCMP2436]|nr:CwfJ C-terminus 2-domain-containing protein-like protein [Pavlovales sp. CCMP2436]
MVTRAVARDDDDDGGRRPKKGKGGKSKGGDRGRHDGGGGGYGGGGDGCDGVDRIAKVLGTGSLAQAWGMDGGGGDGGGEDEGDGRKQKGRTQLYEGGERTRFFADDDKHGLADLYAAAKRTSGAMGGGTDAAIAEVIAGSKKFKGLSAEDEYDHDDGAGMLESRRGQKGGQKSHGGNTVWGAPGGKNISIMAEKAEQRVARIRPLIVAQGNFVYLRVPETEPIARGHCVFEPLALEPASTMASDEVCDELRNFKKCIIQLYAQRGQAAVFLEVAVRLGTHKRCLAIEAVPLPTADFEAAPAYFRKAISEVSDDNAQHKALIDTSGKGIRRSIPPGFAYFHVEFGLERGFAHHIEDEATFPLDFGRQVLEGMLESDDAGIPLHARRKLSAEAQAQNVLAFRCDFEPFDWTKLLREE